MAKTKEIGMIALNKLQAAGIVFPPLCRRLVVDFPVDGNVTLNYQCYATEGDLNIITDVLLKQKDGIKFNKDKQPTGGGGSDC